MYQTPRIFKRCAGKGRFEFQGGVCILSLHIGAVYSYHKGAHFFRIFDALTRFYARRDIHGGWMQAPNGIADIVCIKPTRKNDWLRQFMRNQRPIKGLAATTLTFDEGIEKDRLGGRKCCHLTCQIDIRANAHCLKEWATELVAIGVVFIAMKLQ